MRPASGGCGVATRRKGSAIKAEDRDLFPSLRAESAADRDLARLGREAFPVWLAAREDVVAGSQGIGGPMLTTWKWQRRVARHRCPVLHDPGRRAVAVARHR